MKKRMMISLLIGFLFMLSMSSTVFADGTETLGPPSVAIATGSGIVTAGTGLCTQPGSIEITVPGGTTVKQVLLYWEGSSATNPNGDNQVKVSTSSANCNTLGTPVFGTKIGGPTFTGARSTVTYRADITSLSLIAPGANTVYVCGMDFDLNGTAGECTPSGSTSVRDDGAGILVVFDDGTTPSVIDVRDGNDYAFCANPLGLSSVPSLLTTVPQTFTFAPALFPRIADIDLFASSVAGTTGGGGAGRPSG